MASARKQRWVFGLLLFVFVWGCIELTSFTVYRLTMGSWFSFTANHAARAGLLDAEQAATQAATTQAQARAKIRVPGTMEKDRHHPFIGFVHNYEGTDQKTHLHSTRWGFYEVGTAPPPAENAYRVGVAGGSAAFLFSFKGRERLIEGIRDAPFVDGRPVEVVSLALGGFKQPQQLMTVAWLLSIGEHFDLIVNLDGFNEVAFGTENAQRGVYPAYPRNWSFRVGGRDTLEDLEALGRAAAWSELRRQLASIFETPVVAWTVTGNLIWRLLDRAAAARIQTAEVDVAASIAKDLGYAETGPPFAVADDVALYATIAGHWRHSSQALASLCQASGIRYVHLLQPNQYVAGTKPMGPAERAIAIDPNHIRRESVEKGYPALLREIPALQAAGVEAHDLTRLYATVEAAVYEDSCCHVNQLGNELIADYLVAALLEETP